MTNALYWLVYHIDLGPVGPKVLNLAVNSWLKREARTHKPWLVQQLFGSEPPEAKLNYSK